MVLGRHRSRRRKNGRAAGVVVVVVVFVFVAMSTVRFGMAFSSGSSAAATVGGQIVYLPLWSTSRCLFWSSSRQPRGGDIAAADRRIVFKSTMREGATALYLAEQPRKPANGKKSSTQPEPIFFSSLDAALKRRSGTTESTTTPGNGGGGGKKNQTKLPSPQEKFRRLAPPPKKQQRPRVAAKSKVLPPKEPPKESKLLLLPTLNIVENLQQINFSPWSKVLEVAEEGTFEQQKKQQSGEEASIGGILPFFAISKDEKRTAVDPNPSTITSNPKIRIVPSLQNVVVKKPVSGITPLPVPPPAAVTTMANLQSPTQRKASGIFMANKKRSLIGTTKPLVVGKPPPLTAPSRLPKPMTAATSTATSEESTTTRSVNPIERVQKAMAAKQAEIQQKALQTKEQVMEAVETTTAAIDSSISALQQLLLDIATIPNRIRTAYIRALQFVQAIPPTVEETVQTIAAIPSRVQTRAREVKATITAIPGQIEATKNDIVESIDRAMASVRQTVQTIIDFPAYVQQGVVDTKATLDDWWYEMKVILKQAPPVPRPPKTLPPPIVEPDNPLIAMVVWVVKGVASFTGKVLAAGAGAVVEQVKKKQVSSPMTTSGDDNGKPSSSLSTSVSASPAAVLREVPPRNKNNDSNSKSVDDVTREADEAIRMAEEALQRLKSLRSDDSMS